MRPIALLIAAASLAWPAMAGAQDPVPASSTSDERRLTPQQVEAILAEAAAKREAAAGRPTLESPDEEADAPATPQVHGEVGFGIGTGGYREAYGTAIYPLGKEGVAAISFDMIDWGQRRFRH